MKTQIALSVLGILASCSIGWSAGFRCRATCVAVDSSNQEITFLGSAMQEADARVDAVFYGTEGLCLQRASRNGWGTKHAVLVNGIEFSSSTTRTREREFAAIANRYSVAVATFAYSEFSSRYSSYSKYETRRSLWVDADFASPETNCKFDASIPPGTKLVYSGTTPFYP